MEILIIIAIGVAVYFIWKPKNKKNRNFDATSYTQNEKNILNLKVDSVIKINNAGENFEDLDLKVLAKHLYTQDDYEWYEYECSDGNQKYWLSVEEDDELELALSLKKLKLKDLGIGKSDLERIDDREDGQIQYEGKTYNYDDSDGAVYFRNGDENHREEFYYWEFEDKDEDFFITVENWGGSYEASFGKYIEARQIEFYN